MEATARKRVGRRWVRVRITAEAFWRGGALWSLGEDWDNRPAASVMAARRQAEAAVAAFKHTSEEPEELWLLDEVEFD
jgi:hypothetical protein